MKTQEATTLPEGEEPTPQKEEAITSEKTEEGKPTSPDKKVEKLEGEVQDLTKKLEQATSLQSQADRKARAEALERAKLQKRLDKIKAGEIPEEETSTEDTGFDKSVKQDARIKIQNIIIDSPKYQELIKGNNVLKEVLKNNPFALIGDYIDAEDASEQVKEKLDKLVSAQSTETEPEVETIEKKPEGEDFNAGAPQPKDAPAEDPKPKGPDTSVPIDKVEQSIQNKIRVT